MAKVMQRCTKITLGENDSWLCWSKAIEAELIGLAHKHGLNSFPTKYINSNWNYSIYRVWTDDKRSLQLMLDMEQIFIRHGKTLEVFFE